MKKSLKRTLVTLSATSMLFATSSVLPNNSFNNIGGLIVSAAEQSGDGWSFDDTTGTLTITTNGGIAAWKESIEKSTVIYVDIQNGVKSLGNDPFNGCSNLVSINIPNSVTFIGANAFNGCSSLESITIPDGVTAVCFGSFKNCSSLESITIPNGVTFIGSGAFQGCSNLTSIEIPDSVTSIESSAFYGCSSLESINIPDGVKSIGNGVFQGCSNIKSIEMPDSVTSIGFSLFGSCSGLTSIKMSKNVTSIPDTTFSGCSSLASIEIPNAVTSIGIFAFQNCSSLESITIPYGVTSIGNGTFNGCISLESITISDSVTSIDYRAFYGCTSLTSIEIPNSVTSIGKEAFSNCSNLESITIPDSVTSIDYRAFYGCKSLTSIEIPNSVTSIGESAFGICSKLESITISNGVTSIDSYAFNGCSKLTSMEIPNSITSIGDGAFNSCSSLESITIPDSVTSIGSYVFRFCSNLDNIIYPSSLDVSNASVSGGTTKVEYSVTDDGITITEIILGTGKSDVEIPNIISGKNVIEVAESVRSYVADSRHTHIGGTATCTQKAECTICGTEYGEFIAHNLVKTEAVSPTCTDNGNIAYWYCNDCGKYFSDDNGKTEIQLADTVINAKGHSLTATEEKSATCTDNGNTAYWYCNDCGKYFSDDNGKTEIQLADTVINAKGHSYNNGKCSECGVYENGKGIFSGASLSLSGNIGVNFFMELDGSVIADENAYILFTLPNGKKMQVKVSDAKQTGTYYVFTCEISAKEMNDKITAQIITSDSESSAYEYSVKDYIDYVNDNSTKFDDKTISLVNAMANYGKYAKAYFNNENLTATAEMNGITADTLAGFEKKSVGKLPEGITYYGSSLLLESNTTIRHYFKVAKGTDISEYGFTEKDGYYCKEFSDISADILGKSQNFKIGSYTISYSPMSYAYTVLNSDSTDESLKNLVKALYLYKQAAEAYQK